MAYAPYDQHRASEVVVRQRWILRVGDVLLQLREYDSARHQDV